MVYRFGSTASGPVPDPGAGVTALVLAAGRGSRYRAACAPDAQPHKLLASLNCAEQSGPVLGRTLQALDGLVERTLVLLREDDLALHQWAASWPETSGLQWYSLDSDGLGHSLAQGAARERPQRGYLVVLGDMPFVKRETFQRILACIEPSRLVVPVFAERRGHPRGIGSAFRESLLQCRGDRGAGHLFEPAEAPIDELRVDDPGVLKDVDYPVDLSQAIPRPVHPS